MTFILGLLLLIFVLCVILYPFFDAGSIRRKSGYGNVPSDGSASRERIYEEIKTLTLDRDLGRISEKEYDNYLQRLRADAAMSFRDEEKSECEQNRFRDMVEKEIRIARENRAIADKSGLDYEDSL